MYLAAPDGNLLWRQRLAYQRVVDWEGGPRDDEGRLRVVQEGGHEQGRLPRLLEGHPRADREGDAGAQRLHPEPRAGGPRRKRAALRWVRRALLRESGGHGRGARLFGR